MVNLELYKVFYTVAKCKSITKAAEELFISQPAVSQAIKSLEAQLGGALFNRVSRGMELTETGGKQMFAVVENVMELLSEAEKKFTEMKNVATGSVRIAASDNVINFFLLKYIKEFKENVCDSAVIKFEQGCGPIETEVNVNAGDKISFSGGSASVGYRVKRDGVVGFVTAGHAANSVGKSIMYNGTTIASCEATQQSGNADAAFCAITNSDYSPTNTLSGTSNTLSTTISEPGVGTVINKIGMKTGHTSGKVLSTNVTITFSSGATISNLTSADYESGPGDSGCVVYSYIGSTGARLTLGIHTGASGSGTRYYTKANEVNAALGTSRY